MLALGSLSLGLLVLAPHIYCGFVLLHGALGALGALTTFGFLGFGFVLALSHFRSFILAHCMAALGVLALGVLTLGLGLLRFGLASLFCGCFCFGHGLLGVLGMASSLRVALTPLLSPSFICNRNSRVRSRFITLAEHRLGFNSGGYFGAYLMLIKHCSTLSSVME